MQEQLISFETANLAQEKGFNISTKYGFYYDGEETYFDISYPDIIILRPTQSLLQRWLREVHSIEISVRAIKWENTELKTGLVLDSYEYEMYPLKKPYYIYHKVPKFKTYELALEEALQEALKLIKNVNKSN